VYNCQKRVGAQFQEVHHFLQQVVDNLRAQAAFITNLLTSEKEDKAWKQDAEANIRQVQTAGNKLEDQVRLMGEAAVLVRLEQEDKNKNVAAQMKDMDDEITQLQKDILDQDGLNKEM
jgi:hypothetical protein